METDTPVEAPMRCGRNATEALRHGVTGMRIVGDAEFIDIAWRNAFNDGVFVGPRLFVCGKFICASGADLDDKESFQVSGPYEMRQAVRENLKRGVDQIKLYFDAGGSVLLPDEIEAATEVAHQKGKRVCIDVDDLKMVVPRACRSNSLTGPSSAWTAPTF